MSLPRVQVTIRRGMQLPAMDSGKTSDPYIKFEYRGTTYRTTTIKKTVDPAWNETFVFAYDQQFGPHTLTFEVWDANVLMKDKKMGSVTVNLRTLQMDTAVSKVYPLEDAALAKIGAAVEIELKLLRPLSSFPASSSTAANNPKPSSGQTVIILTPEQAKAAAQGRILLQPNHPGGSAPVSGYANAYPPYNPGLYPSPPHSPVYPVSSSSPQNTLVSHPAGLQPHGSVGPFYAPPGPPQTAGPPYSYGAQSPGNSVVPPPYLYPAGGGLNPGTTMSPQGVCGYPCAPSPPGSFVPGGQGASTGPYSPPVPPSLESPSSPAVVESPGKKAKQTSSSSSSSSSSDPSSESDSDEKKHKKKKERKSKENKTRRRKEKAADSVLLVEIKNIIPSATYGEIAKALVANNNDKDLALKQLVQNLKSS
ncbi:c2 domain protein [Cystoisospora suis]|uniref:C2 domain protein n=1 Tax=Cystoisospora suis TaxID=483139 RepID=A0A2C6L1I8_9APIC|nr:c2 domain protein [Cystoisospora suis]